jgi:glutamine amidotransferase
MNPRAVIVDYEMGNVFSVQRACTTVGFDAVISSSPEAVRSADAIVLPGMGAFGDAMKALTRLGLVDAIRDAAGRGVPLLGVCLGLQLLMTESEEFGLHRGLDLVRGRVVRFPPADSAGARVKVPHVGWAPIYPLDAVGDPCFGRWPLTGLNAGEHMYFVHSYYVVPDDPLVVRSVSSYRGTRFCSALGEKRLFGCQFHPERSGPKGLQIYANFRAQFT